MVVLRDHRNEHRHEGSEHEGIPPGEVLFLRQMSLARDGVESCYEAT